MFFCRLVLRFQLNSEKFKILKKALAVVLAAVSNFYNQNHCHYYLSNKLQDIKTG